MFVNQAAASAILVGTLHRHGTGGERVVDALVGGAVAFVLGVLLFPADPMSMLRDAERSVLRTLAQTLRQVAERMSANTEPDDHWALREGSAIHRQLAALTRAQRTAHANVRVAPRRWHLRDSVDAESRRMMRLELLANAVLGLVRAAATDVHGTEPIASEVQRQVVVLSEAMARLAATPQPWPDTLRLEVSQLAGAASAQPPVERGSLAAAVLRAAARDLSDLTETPRAD